MDAIQIVSSNPNIKVGLLALMLGYDLSQDGLIRAARQKRHILRTLRLQLRERLTAGLRDVSCAEVGGTHDIIPMLTDPYLVDALPRKSVDPVYREKVRQLRRARAEISAESLRTLPRWGYIADDREIGHGEGRSQFDPSDCQHTGAGWMARLESNMLDLSQQCEAAL